MNLGAVLNGAFLGRLDLHLEGGVGVGVHFGELPDQGGAVLGRLRRCAHELKSLREHVRDDDVGHTVLGRDLDLEGERLAQRNLAGHGLGHMKEFGVDPVAVGRRRGRGVGRRGRGVRRAAEGLERGTAGVVVAGGDILAGRYPLLAFLIESAGLRISRVGTEEAADQERGHQACLGLFLDSEFHRFVRFLCLSCWFLLCRKVAVVSVPRIAVALLIKGVSRRASSS